MFTNKQLKGISWVINNTKKDDFKGIILSDLNAYLSDVVIGYILILSDNKKGLKGLKRALNDKVIINKLDSLQDLKDFQVVKTIKNLKDFQAIRGKDFTIINDAYYQSKYIKNMFDVLGDNIVFYQEQKTPMLLKAYSDNGFGVLAPTTKGKY